MIPAAEPSPLRRLTNREYDLTVHDLLGDHSQPARSFAPDEKIGGFASNAVALVDKDQVGAYVDAAEALATDAVETRLELDCDLAEPECVGSFVDGFGALAHRRPLDAAARASYLALFDAAVASDASATEALAMVVEAMLLSPEFLYHVELSLPATGEPAIALDEYELAARLSYFLWSSMPDAELFQAAAAGRLRDPAELESQAWRMLADPRSADGLNTFTDQWLEIEQLPLVAKTDEAWTEEIAQAMRLESLAFVRSVAASNEPTLAALLSAQAESSDPVLASYYGDQGPRSGLLTMGAFLTSHAHADQTSWVHRGKFIREKLLCDLMPAPPADVDMSVPRDTGRLDNPSCAPCHKLMDPIGVAFDSYDAAARWVGPGPSGEIIQSGADDPELAKSYDDAIALAHDLAPVPQVMTCFTDHWMRLALGRVPEGRDEASRTAAAGEFIASGGDLRELMIAIVKSDAFTYRAASTGEAQ